MVNWNKEINSHTTPKSWQTRRGWTIQGWVAVVVTVVLFASSGIFFGLLGVFAVVYSFKKAKEVDDPANKN